ncbi:hypothetical protein CKM354_001037700 [Cercospora kikuchii]|uniref:Uncharacterized protein n=1 Tax=Cercospora kikuchii TaxID=84275 RepID=A0A9P3FH86_9PEZI|nr:uncharacterized protein CKM354_001037700 [Cercospora kikuchii]GIZ47281.1 hypothetical protein CKM354_001037700 [Cercospora kikuchii]
MADNTATTNGATSAQSRLTATAAPAPGDYQGEAAMKVFAVPELLEHILIQAVVGQHTRDRELSARRDDEFGALKMWPMPGYGNITKGGVCLFRIQRVNKTFRNTIQGSTKLKQLIYLAPRDNADLLNEKHLGESYYPMHKPLVSLIRFFDENVDNGHTGLMDLMAEGDDINGVQIMRIELNYSVSSSCATPYEKVIGVLPKGWHNAEASWKKIKVCNAKTLVPLEFVMQSDDSWEDEGLPFNPINWPLDGSETLEQVFDLFTEVLDAVEGHKKGKRAMDEERDAWLSSSRKRANRKRRELEEDIREEEELLVALHAQDRQKLLDELDEKLNARVMIVEERQIRQTQAKRE